MREYTAEKNESHYGHQLRNSVKILGEEIARLRYFFKKIGIEEKRVEDDIVREKVEQLTEKIYILEQLTYGDRRHAQFSALLESVRLCETDEDMDEIVETVSSVQKEDGAVLRQRFVNCGNIRPSEKGSFQWRKVWYAPNKMPWEKDEKKQGQLAIEKEIAKKIRTLLLKHREVNAKKIKELLSFEPTEEIPSLFGGEKRSGSYYKFHLLEGPKEGVLLLRLAIRRRKRSGDLFWVLEVCDAAGCYEWLAEFKGMWVALTSAIYGKLSERNSSEKKEYLKRIVVICNRHLWPLYVEHKFPRKT